MNVFNASAHFLSVVVVVVVAEFQSLRSFCTALSTRIAVISFLESLEPKFWSCASVGGGHGIPQRVGMVIDKAAELRDKAEPPVYLGDEVVAEDFLLLRIDCNSELSCEC